MERKGENCIIIEEVFKRSVPQLESSETVVNKLLSKKNKIRLSFYVYVTQSFRAITGRSLIWGHRGENISFPSLRRGSCSQRNPR